MKKDSLQKLIIIAATFMLLMVFALGTCDAQVTVRNYLWFGDSSGIPTPPAQGDVNVIARGTLGLYLQFSNGNVVRLDSAGGTVDSVRASWIADSAKPLSAYARLNKNNALTGRNTFSDLTSFGDTVQLNSIYLMGTPKFSSIGSVTFNGGVSVSGASSSLTIGSASLGLPLAIYANSGGGLYTLTTAAGANNPSYQLQNLTDATYYVATLNGAQTFTNAIWNGTAIDTTYSSAVSNVVVNAPLTVSTGGKTKIISVDTSAGNANLATQAFVLNNSGGGNVLLSQIKNDSLQSVFSADTSNNEIYLMNGERGEASGSVGFFSTNLNDSANQYYRGAFTQGFGMDYAGSAFSGPGGMQTGVISNANPGTLFAIIGMNGGHGNERSDFAYFPYYRRTFINARLGGGGTSVPPDSGVFSVYDGSASYGGVQLLSISNTGAFVVNRAYQIGTTRLGGPGGVDTTTVLTKTTLGSTVVNSSLTSVGTIGTGVWNGTAIDTTYSSAVSNVVVNAPLTVSTGGKTKKISADTSAGNANLATQAFVLNNSGSGEVNTASNLAGAGVGIWKDKSTYDLRFKRLKGTTNQITIADSTDSLTFSLPQNIHTTATPQFTSIIANDGASGITTLTGTTLSGSLTTVTGGGTLTMNGGSGANDDLLLQGTTSATRTTSYVAIQPNGGNFGIGISAPVNFVQMHKATSPILHLTNTASGATTGDGFLYEFGVGGGSSIDCQFWNFENGYWRLGTNNTERIRVINSGEAGFGLTPSASAGIIQTLAADDGIGQNIKINATSASVTTADVFINFASTSGVIGSVAGTASSGVIAYNTFTGGHYAQLQNEAETFEVGMLVASTGQTMANTEQLALIRKTSERMEKAVYGVWAGLIAQGAAQSEVDSFKAFKLKKEERQKNRKTPKTKADSLQLAFEDSVENAIGLEWDARKAGKTYTFAHGDGHKDLHQVLAVGTGVALVTNTNGNISNGDLICSSQIPGLGERQADDIVHSYTVAKATESVDWSGVPAVNGVKKKLIAVTYK